ncbi:MAG: hypothetical protein ACE5KH_05900 [Candidatus Geothermarchaeales archaeon]
MSAIHLSFKRLTPPRLGDVGIVLSPLTLLLFEYVNILSDQVVHLGTLALALFLSITSTLAYRRDRRLRFLFLSSAFTLFSIREIFSLANTFVPGLPETLVFLGQHPADHLINLWVLLLFFVGVIRK